MPLSDKEREISTTIIKEIESNVGANGKVTNYHDKTTFLSKQTSLAEAGIYAIHKRSGYIFDIGYIAMKPNLVKLKSFIVLSIPCR